MACEGSAAARSVTGRLFVVDVNGKRRAWPLPPDRHDAHAMTKSAKNAKHGIPRRKRMNTTVRLQHARDTKWTSKYNGKNIVHGYGKWFGVDLLCAVRELRLLGIAISADREEQLRTTVEARAKARKHQREIKESQSEFADTDSDDTFAYIVGYTSGGVPYGVTWEEMGEISPSNLEERREQDNACRRDYPGDEGDCRFSGDLFL